MGRRAILVILLLAAGILAVVIYRWWHPPEAVVVRRTLEAAAQAASWKSAGGTLSQLAAATRVADYCTADVEILLDTAGSSGRRVEGRDTLRQAVAAARLQVQWLRLELMDVEVSVVDPGKKAIVLMATSVSMAGISDPVVQDYEVAMVRERDGWKISRVEPVKGFGM